jgi:hypothetical protein
MPPTPPPDQAGDLVVVEPLKDFTCAGCRTTDSLLLKMEDAGPFCMTCADLDHLVFLPRGDTALTRRSRKASALSAIVVRWSRSRKRYERQGVLVEEAALELAEQQCLADADVRARQRERAERRREQTDVAFQASFAAEIRRLFPGCPSERAAAIAAHAGQRGSGRVGRSASGRALEEAAVTGAVIASVRHEDTAYDALLMQGVERADARQQVREPVTAVLESWRPVGPRE